MSSDWPEIASNYVKEGNLNKAIEIYKNKLGIERVPSELMISWGDLGVLNKRYEIAFRAYRLAGSKSKLHALCRHLEETGNPTLAEKVSAYLVVEFSI